MSALQEYLQSLNTSENQWGLWVNPENPSEEYRIGQYCFENGGLRDNWIHVGSLDNLSFGFQSTHDAIKAFLKDCENGDRARFEYKGKMLLCHTEGIVSAYSDGLLDEEFQAFLEQQAAEIEAQWAEDESSVFVSDRLPEILEQAKVEAFA